MKNKEFENKVVFYCIIGMIILFVFAKITQWT
jgi:hypothetical protein